MRPTVPAEQFYLRRLTKVLTAALLIFAAVFQATPASASLACFDVFRPPHDTEPWFEKISFTKTEATLSRGRVVAVKDLKKALADIGKAPSGTTIGLALVTFADGTRAVWKPGESSLTEVAAYRLAREVGSHLVPPTVERTFDDWSFDKSVDSNVADKLRGQTGSLQYFVHTSIDLVAMGESARGKVWDHVPTTQKAQRDIFNYVFGNWDLHWGNILIDDSHSIVQIDNGVIRSRQKVRFGELPFIRRMSFSESARKANAQTAQGPFPFDEAVHFERPDIGQFISHVKPFAEPAELAKWVILRTEIFKTANLTMNVVMWDNAVWIQAVGFQNRGALKPPVFPAKTLGAYRELTFEKLREILPAKLFRDVWIREVIERRDQILAEADLAGVTR